MTDEEFDEFIKDEDIDSIEELAKAHTKEPITSSITVISNPTNEDPNKEMEAELMYEELEEYQEFLLNNLTNNQKIVFMMELLKGVTSITSVDYNALDKSLQDKYWDWNNTECTDNYYYDYNQGRRRGFDDSHYTSRDYYTPAKSINNYSSKGIDDFCELAIKDYKAKVYISFSAIATAKIFIMKLYNPHIEFGGYLSYKNPLPNIEDLYEEGDIFIEIDDLLLIPQKRDSSHIEYFEFDLPEFMQDWRTAKENKLFTSGRYHSHHTLSAFHSTTDKGEIEEMAKQKSKFISVVSAFKKTPFDKNTDLINFEYFLENTQIDSVLYIPFEDDKEAKENEATYGYYIETGVMFSDYTQDDLKEVQKFITRFVEMEIFIKEKYPVINALNRLVEKKVLDENDVYYIRKQLNESDSLYTVFTSIFETMNNLMINSKGKEYDELIKQIKKLV